MLTSRVFMVQMADTPGPWINFRVAKNDQNISHGTIGAFLRGNYVLTNYKPVTLLPSSSVRNIDYFCDGSVGLLSQKAIDALHPYLTKCFDLLEVYIKGRSYFYLRTIAPLDCLNREQSELVMADDDPTWLLSIEKYVFKKDLIPAALLFAIPEMPARLFAMDSIREVISKAGLHCFYAFDAETEYMQKRK